MHNTSYIWTAVTKQTWAQRPSQTNPVAKPCGGRREPVWRTEVFISGDFTQLSEDTVYMCCYMSLFVYVVPGHIEDRKELCWKGRSCDAVEKRARCQK